MQYVIQIFRSEIGGDWYIFCEELGELAHKKFTYDLEVEANNLCITILHGSPDDKTLYREIVGAFTCGWNAAHSPPCDAEPLNDYPKGR